MFFLNQFLFEWLSQSYSNVPWNSVQRNVWKLSGNRNKNTTALLNVPGFSTAFRFFLYPNNIKLLLSFRIRFLGDLPCLKNSPSVVSMIYPAALNFPILQKYFFIISFSVFIVHQVVSPAGKHFVCRFPRNFKWLWLPDH